ncbi:formylglycine-generating enzyme family protein [Desulfatiglans anilini]|uniref:formylglycine-generating enzyme family protein n=1 Tax=Desulfatiglans anilini TaxID=90728 RepID=UPI000A01FF0D|nr:formylglycine-generating enzyme family protein [Desulfatiglans anilini]
MIYVEAGEFIMGSDTDGNFDEQPQRKVYIDGYFIDKYLVTNEQYREFIIATGYPAPYIDRVWAKKYCWKDNCYPDGTRDHPVVLVTWHDAAAYAEWAGKRLPTEAEWEKAARGTEGLTWPWGNEWSKGRSVSTGSGSPKPVGGYEEGKSPFGCYDMAGNVWEWVGDWYQEDYYRIAPSVNPKGPSEGAMRVLRGGSWIHDSASSRCARRYSRRPEYADNYIGFRCAKNS